MNKKDNNFTYIDPISAVKMMNPGWNLGNTLDAIPTEGSWNNPPAQEYIFDDIKESGFKSIRIPVTWTHHIGPSPDYKIDEKWMDRVEEVVDWVLKRNLFAVLNVHHDSWEWLQYINRDGYEVINKLDHIWEQIAQRFKDKSEKLIFEVINEPTYDFGDVRNNPEDTKKAFEIQHQVNDRILKIIRSSGGFNDKRLVIVPGIWTDSEKTLEYFKVPDDKNIILTVHYYTPWDFVANWWGRVIWGSQDDIKYIDNLFERLYNKFILNGIPIVIGEYGVEGKTHTPSRWKWLNFVVYFACKYGMTTMLWDNGKIYDRLNRRWRDKTAIDFIINASKGIQNSYCDDMLYIKINENNIYTQNDIKPVIFNSYSNHLLAIYNGEYKLEYGKDYFIEENRLIFLLSFIKQLIWEKQPGIITILNLVFEKGINFPLDIILYKKPELNFNEYILNKSYNIERISIPVKFNGTFLATVKAVDLLTCKPIKESHTPFLKHGDFDYDDNNIYLSKEFLMSLTNDAKLTFIFWGEECNVDFIIKVLN